MGHRIQELRREQGHTQETSAAKLGMLPSNYARLEQGRLNTTVNTLVRIAGALDVDVGQLFAAPKRRRSRPGRPRKNGD